MTGIRLRSVPVRPPRVKQWTAAGWAGMYDSRHVKAEMDGEAPIIINMVPLDPARQGSLQLRSGMTRLTTPTTTQLASAASWQGAGSFFLGANGTFMILVVSGGEIYTLNLSTGALTKVISTANLTAAAITLSATSIVSLTQFARTVVVADQNNNVPFVWEGTTGGGLTKLTNVPTTHQGPPTVYYGKLFWIKASSPTIIWSEENQPNTGYEAGGYNNAWDLTQTGGGNLFGILGTNEGLYYWRHETAGVIRGAATSTFSSDGVHDSISQESGIYFFSNPVWSGDAIWWVGNDGHPMVFRPDVGAVDLGQQIARRFASPQGAVAPDLTFLGSIGEEYANLGNSGAMTVLVDRPNQRVQFEYAASTGLLARRVLIFDSNTLKLVAVHVYPTANLPNLGRQWAVILPTGATWPSVVHKVYCDINGYIFREFVGLANAQGWGGPIGYDETEAGTGSPVVGTLIGPMHGWSTGTEWQFTQLDLLTDALPNNSVSVGYITSRFHKASLTQPDQTLADTATLTPYERRKPFGLNTTGRWLRPVIQISGEATTNRLPELHAYTLTGVPLSATPNVT